MRGVNCMDEKKILDMIQSSGENVDAPEKISPEQIKRLLESEPVSKRSRWKRFIQWGAVAAVFALVIIGSITGLTKLSGNEEKISAVTEAGTMDMAEAESIGGTQENVQPGGESAEETETEKAAAAGNELYVFAGAANYKEIYDVLEKLTYGEGYDAGAAYGARGVTEESATDMTASSAQKEAGVDYSVTNLQELGVDEADIIKTDGKYLYVLKTTGSVCLIRAQGESLEIEGTIQLRELNETPQEMYIDGDTLNLIATGSKTTLQNQEEDVYEAETEDYTKLYTYDISDRTDPKLTGTVKQQGNYATSRKNGDIVYLFTRFYPEVKDSSDIDSYVPAVNGARLESTDVYLPEYRNSTSYLVVSSVDNRNPDEALDQKAIVSAADNFYVSENNIYICNTNWSSDTTMTQILRFGYADGRITSTAAADLKGSLNDTFSLNEYDGYLRVVLTDYSGDTQRNSLYVLNENMEVTGSISDIAEGEDIRSARFMGETGYFVTFRNTDPLFSVDLSDPANPVLLGELKITGFSSYLHFYGENKLLGVGNEVDPETGEYLGIKLAMFDVSDPANVKQLHKFVIRDTWDCPLFYDYRAAMIDTEKNIFGFMCDSSYMIFTYDEEEGFKNVFTENLSDTYYSSYYYGTQGVRGCFIGDTFYLIGGGQIRIYDMANGYAQLGRLEL